MEPAFHFDLFFQSLKNHAVTLFEVGKLSDEALDSFIEELQNVCSFFFADGSVVHVAAFFSF